MKRIDQIYAIVKSLCEEQLRNYGTMPGVSTEEVAARLGIHRTNTSCDLNKLVKADKLDKIEGKPVIYQIKFPPGSTASEYAVPTALDDVIGSAQSLKNAVQQAKAAVMYPPFGLHILLLGETGTGKSMFAEAMYRYGQDIGRLKVNAPFVSFNCADYANNPQLLLAQLFGVKKGSFTGADVDRNGIVAKANQGVLFLDEIHRLPPEGQEMLFYLIDRGMYRSLGEVDEYKKAQLLIFCATTENPDSVLLKTFLRRIPMMISLPPLRERTVEERWHLVKHFFSREVQHLKVPVHISPNALKAFLLYDCPNNIGQLKSDIKLSCARAFLDFVTAKEKGLRIQSEDLPSHVRQGLIRYKQYRNDIETIGLAGDVIFPVTEKDICLPKSSTANIYEVLEQKVHALRSKGLSEEDIQLILSLDIDVYIRQYVTTFRRDNLNDLYNFVDKKIVDVVQQFLQYAARQVGREFDDKILCGMSIHIANSMKRIQEGKPVKNPQLAEIRQKYGREYKIAEEAAKLINHHFGITVPPDEIGFITMFLILDERVNPDLGGRVSVIVAMHGNSTASSMADVANRLLGEKCAAGYDMSLDRKPELALEEVTQLVIQQDQGQGVLLLVDMGSLVMFGNIIHEKTAIPIKAIEMVSTPMVLEAARKAIMLAPLDEIYRSVSEVSSYVGNIYWNSSEFSFNLRGDVIVTACITGKGTAIKLKTMIERMVNQQGRKIDIIPLDIASMEDYNQKLAKIKREKNLLAVVSSYRPADSSINFISLKDILKDNIQFDLLLLKLEKPVKLAISHTMDKIEFMADVINQNIAIDGNQFIAAFKKFYTTLSENHLNIVDEHMVGLILHLACTVERLLNGEAIPNQNDTKPDITAYGNDFAIVKTALQYIEQSFQVNLPLKEHVEIIKLIHYGKEQLERREL